MQAVEAGHTARPCSGSNPLGYRDPAYVQSLAEYGVPRKVSNADGWVIERAVPGEGLRDAMGPYPLFSCRDWQGLSEDLRELRNAGLVSLVLVTDPLLTPEDQRVFRHFDVARPFKTHYLAALDCPLEEIVSRHHRYYVRRAARVLEVDIPEVPLDYLDEWVELHEHLQTRHRIVELRAFSRTAFAGLLAMDGVAMLRVLLHGRIVGGMIVVMQGDIAYPHVASYSSDGYRLGASYLLYWETLRYCRERARYVNWGGGVGQDVSESSGLVRNKLGWSNVKRQSFLLGAVLDRGNYAMLNEHRATHDSAYFPAYRTGEFG